MLTFLLFSYLQPESLPDSVSLHSLTSSNSGTSDIVKGGAGDSVKGVSGEGGGTKHKKGKGFRKGKSDKKIKESASNVSMSILIPHRLNP